MSKSSNRIKRTALIVLGMHRSGTSALSGVLAKLGAEVPRTLMPPTADNPKGYWESSAIMEFNNAILASAGSSWDEWEAFNRGWLGTTSGKATMSKLPALLDQEFGDAPLFLIKDPRICRLLPVWLHALDAMDVAAKIVIPVRNPIEVAQSLEIRNKTTRLQALSIWLRHVLDAEHASRGQDRVIVQYVDLLADWRSETSRIAQVLGIEWPRMSGRTEAEVDEYLDQALKHHATEQRLPAGSQILGWVSETYAAYCDLAESRNGEAAQGRLDAVRQAFDASSSAFAPLFHEVRSDLMRRLEARSVDASRLAEEVKELRTDHESIKQQRVADEEVILKQKECTEAMKKKIQAREAVLSVVREELTAAKSELASVTETSQGQIAALQRECAELTQRSEELLDRLSAAESRARDAVAERIRMEEFHREQITSLDDRLGARIEEIDKQRVNAEALATERLSEIVVLSKRLIELENVVSTGQSIISKLKTEQGDQAASLAADRRRVEDRDRRIQVLDSELSAQSAVISEYRRTLGRIHAGSRWTLSGDLRKVAGKAVEVGIARQSASEIEVLVRKSKLFDADWYLATYPDVRKRKMDPVKHYLRYGAKEGRDPGPVFSTSGYNANNPDVATASMNPLMHYLVYGRKEGRSIAAGDSRTARKV